VTLYRDGGFDAAVTKTFSEEPVPPLNAAVYHAPLEAAVGEFVKQYSGSAPLPRGEPAD
jgi:hypothetical protein